jgi:hypothetical protein
MESVPRKRRRYSKTPEARAREYARRKENAKRDHIEFPKEKHCYGCKRTMPADAFYVEKRAACGLSSRCKDCVGVYQRDQYARKPERSLESSRQYRAQQARKRDEFIAAESGEAPPTMKREIGVYGIGIEEFCELNRLQSGRCAICHRLPDEVKGHRSKRLYIDHCHETGVVRGLLCTSCNGAIGYFKNNVRTLIAAAKYLTKGASHNGDSTQVEPVLGNVPVCREFDWDFTDLADSDLDGALACAS